MSKISRYTILNSMKPILRRSKRQIKGVIISKFLGVVLGLITPGIYMLYMNKVLQDGDKNFLIYVVISYVIVYLFLSISISIGTYCENKYRNFVRLEIKKKLLTKFSKLTFSDFETYSIGDMRNRIEVDVLKLQDFYVKHIVNFFFSICSIIAFSVIMLLLNWQLTLVGFVGVIISIVATRIIGVEINRIADKYRSNMGEFEGCLLYGLHNWKEIKMNNLEQKQQDLLNTKWKRITKLLMKQTVLKYFSTALVAVNMFIATRLGIYIFGGLLVLNNYLSVSTLLVFIAYYDNLHKEFNNLVQSIVDFKVEKPVLGRIMDILNLQIEKKQNISTKGDLKVSHLSFSYDHERNVLDGISFEINENSHVALVGKSGCGKTTIVKILLGLIKQDFGEVEVGNVDLSILSDEARCKIICAVMQEPKFFNLSIADNLRLVNPKISLDEMNKVCKMANIYEFIHTLPDKYDTIIGEKGLKLSGGQRQRLAIARTMIRNPQIIIFDEATSALDNENEKIIVNAIQNIAKEKTILTIAHRFATVEFADEIIMIQSGKIYAKGNKKDLIEKYKEFRSLFTNQIVDFQ